MREVEPLAVFRQRLDRPPVASDWLRVDQAMIDSFARTTGDDAFIHVDPDRASRTRFKGTIAHGLLTLSLLPLMMRSAMPIIKEARIGVNYGFDRVRFIRPVPVGSHVRGVFGLADLDESKPGFLRVTYDVTVEIADSEQPAAAARWMLGQWLARPELR